MLKLLKYDLIKSRAWYAITVSAVLLIEALFLIGFWGNFGKVVAIGGVLFILAGIFGVFALLIYSVQLYSDELNKKSGYMTFLTPRNAYQILGSKLLVSLMALIVGFGVYAALALLNVQLTSSIEGNLIGELFSMISPEDVPQLLLLVFNSLFQWFVTIITIYFSITLSATLLGNMKLRWLISALIFLGINGAIGALSSLLTFDKALSLGMTVSGEQQMTFSFFLDNSTELMLIALVINAVLGIGFYLGTAALAEKKLSL